MTVKKLIYYSHAVIFVIYVVSHFMSFSGSRKICFRIALWTTFQSQNGRAAIISNWFTETIREDTSFIYPDRHLSVGHNVVQRANDSVMTHPS